MRLSSLLGCRRRTSRPAGLVGGSHRPELYRPRLELLEDRLPPGDMLPGGLLGSPLWGPSSSAVDPDPWTPEGTSAGSLPASLRGTGRSQWTVTVSGRLAAEPVLAAADHPHVQPQHEGGETAPLLAGGSGVGSRGSAHTLFNGDDLFASALTDPLSGSGAPRRSTAAASPDPVGPAHVGGEAAGGGAAASPNVAEGASAGVPGGAQPVAPAGAGSGLAALSHDAGMPHASPAAPRALHQGPTVHATFDLSATAGTAGAAFPSNRFTVADAGNLTDLRVNLPLPNPAANPSDYQATQVINTPDGFNLQPRLSLPFDRPHHPRVGSV